MNHKNISVQFLNGRNIYHFTVGARDQITKTVRDGKPRGVSLRQADNIITQADMHLQMYFDFCDEKGFKYYKVPPREYLGD